MNETEGLVRYRLLGSHPAASGRHLTLGFPGESITAARLLHAVVTEHQINLSTYKLSIVKVQTPTLTNHALKADDTAMEGMAEEAVPVNETDVIHTYDVLAITVSKRSLMDQTAQEAKQRLMEQKLLVNQMESQLGIEATCASSTSINITVKRDNNYADTSKSNLSSSSADPLGFERAAALATKTFPIMRGRCAPSDTVNEEINASRPQTCVLCDLNVFSEVRTACCNFCVCATCLEAARGMAMSDGECPVCGRIGETAGCESGSSDIVKREREDIELRERSKTPKLESSFPNSSYMTNKSKSLSSSCGLEGERSKGARGVEGCYSSNTTIEVRSRWPHTTEDSWEGVPRSNRCVEDSRGCNINGFSETPEIEQQLQNDLDQILSYLDVPDPLTADIKARRKRSKVLMIMDEQVLQI